MSSRGQRMLDILKERGRSSLLQVDSTQSVENNYLEGDIEPGLQMKDCNDVVEEGIPSTSSTSFTVLENVEITEADYTTHDNYLEIERDLQTPTQTGCSGNDYELSDNDYYDDVDDDYLPTEDGSSEEESVTNVSVEDGPSEEKVRHAKKKIFAVKEKSARKRTRNPNTWRRKSAAIARQKGEGYLSQKTGKCMPEKKPNLNGLLCNEKCRLKCNDKFNASARAFIFKAYYKLDGNAKNALIFKSINIKPISRHRPNVKKQKMYTFKYTVTFDTEVIQVCKRTMCTLYQFSQKKLEMIQTKLKAGNTAPTPDKRGHHDNRPHKIPDNVIETIVEHINKFPAESSHYSRHNNPNKKYLSPLLNISKLYRLYVEKCKEMRRDRKFIVKECSYRNVFVTRFNLSFGQPKSDTCSTCDAGESSEEHKQNYIFAFQQQRNDRERARASKNLYYITMDLQQTMPLPRLTTSKAFYLRQMWFYNLGIHTVSPAGDKPFFFTWTEDVAHRGSLEIASCFHTFSQMNEDFRKNNNFDIIVWSDSCSGQNKNFSMIAMYQYLILKGFCKTIDHKFPEVGHTYLDSDRDFGRIEKSLRKTETLYVPDQYRNLIKESSSKNSVVINMDNHFKKIDELARKMQLVNKKKNVLNEKVHFRDSIKWIRVEEYGSFLYKESLDEYTPFLKVDLLKKGARVLSPEAVSLTRITEKFGSISAEKISNLQDQIKFVDDEYKWFYEKIIKDNNTVDIPKKKRKTT